MGDFFISIDELRMVLGTAEAPMMFDVCRSAKYGEFDRILPTSRWREHTRVNEWAAEIPYGSKVVVNCVHGHNVSQLATSVLREKGVDARALQGGIEGWKAAGAPTILKDALPGRDENKPSRWVTRVRPKIDRVACPWLIRKEVGGIPYDIDGVEITHDGPLCSFDTLIKRFGIKDAALDAVALIVRGADTARMDLAPEAAGLLAISLGNSALAGGDDRAALAKGFPVYDALYAWARHARGETHNWPAKTA
jgi:rhodanese-related sulfurtransferase